jgi:hypothetical protein
MTHHNHNEEGVNVLHGVAAEYETGEQLLAAVEIVRKAGYQEMDAYSPIPVHGLYEAMGRKRTLLPFITLAGALGGGFGGLMLQVWVSAIEYPLNVGGRPFLSFVSFFPVTFECTILGAALATLGAMFAMNRFPEPYHPIFNTPGFEAASRDRYFLCIEATDPKFESAAVQQVLKGTAALAVSEVKP